MTRNLDLQLLTETLALITSSLQQPSFTIALSISVLTLINTFVFLGFYTFNVDPFALLYLDYNYY